MTLHKTNATTTDNEKIKVSIAASFLLSLTLFFFGPANLYYTNIREMPFLFSNIWYYILAGSLVVGLSLFILLRWLKGPYHTKVSTLVFALGFLFWIQGNVLVWDYGLLDGHEIIFENYFWNGVIDSLAWIGILIAGVLYSKRLYRHIAVLCSLLLIAQAAGLMATAYSAPEEPEWKNLQHFPDHKKMYEFSTKMNVIIIILDTFQSDIFQEIIDENPEYSNMFYGFTYYRNNVGGFPTTYPSVMYILSGKLYDNSVPISQFIKNTSLHNSLPLVLKENGVRVDIKTGVSTIFPSSKIYDTIDGFSWKPHEGYSAENISEITPIYRLTFFRFVPQALKRYFYRTSSTKLENPDIEDEYPNFNSAIRVSAPERIFKLFHLRGPHAPFYLNENLIYEDLPQDIAGYKSQAKASLKISYALLESLKRNSSYDNSLIFIIGDHGTGSGTDVVSGGTPLMLVKAFNSTGSLAISDSPVSLGDIPKTIADELKLNSSLPGSSIFSVNETDSRLRIHYSYIWHHEYWYKDSLPPLREYQISGFSWNTSSWEPTYREYTSEGVKYVPPPLYTPGSIIHFGIGGNAEQYLTSGWSGPEEGFRWTDGHTAVFTCSLPKPETDLILNVTFTPFLGAGMRSQNLSIWMNEHKLQDVLLTSDMQKLTIAIPRNYSEKEIQRIKFDLPNAISPSELGISADGRTLGIGVSTLSMNPSVKVT
jgi:hypothetical protein